MPKSKVSVIIDHSVLERVDRAAEGMSRSEVFERALKRWLSERSRQTLEDRVAAYYRDRGVEEVAEDREWAELSASQVYRTW